MPALTRPPSRARPHAPALVLTTLAVFAAFALPAHAQTILASSTFDSNADGWTVVDLPAASGLTTPITQDGGPFAPTYHSTGGNTGGYISVVDPDANYYYWYAPAKFLGSKAASYEGMLSFDLISTDAGAGLNPRGEDIILVGAGGVTVSRGLATPATTIFTHYALPMTPAGWTNVGTGQAATAADMQAALGSLSSLYILGDFENGTDTGSLDNVVLTAAPEPSQFAAPGTGILGLGALALRARRRTRA